MNFRQKISSLPAAALIVFLAAGTFERGVAGDKQKQKQLESESRLKAIDGKEIKPLKPEKGKPAVVIFITTDCPIANGYAPEINRIVGDYVAKGVKFTLVQVDPDLSAPAAARHAADYGFKVPVVIDREHRLVKATGATVTPEAAVIGPDGKLAYLGRINDRYAGYGDRRAAVKEHNLRESLDALLAGKPVPRVKVEPIGCFIPELE